MCILLSRTKGLMSVILLLISYSCGNYFKYVFICLYFTTLHSPYYNFRMINWWIVRKSVLPNRGTIQVFSWGRKRTMETVNIADVPADIPTEYLLNTTLELYRVHT